MQSVVARTCQAKEQKLRATEYDKFVGELICGTFEHAAEGLLDHLKVDKRHVLQGQLDGVDAIVREVHALGNGQVAEQLDYILNQEASEVMFDNGMRDAGRAGKKLAYFLEHETCKAAKLDDAEVVALRLYTTQAFREINEPLRDQGRQAAHPLPVTVVCIADGIRKLRRIAPSRSAATQSLSLWRGLKNIKITDRFMKEGGTEVGSFRFELLLFVCTHA